MYVYVYVFVCVCVCVFVFVRRVCAYVFRVCVFVCVCVRVALAWWGGDCGRPGCWREVRVWVVVPVRLPLVSILPVG